MRNRPCLTCLNTGKGWRVSQRLTWTTLISYLLLFLSNHYRNRLIPQWIVRVFVKHFKYTGRTGRYTITAPITFICIDTVTK